MNIFSLFDDQPETIEVTDIPQPSDDLNIQDGCLFGGRCANGILVLPETVRCIAPFAFKGDLKIKEIYFPKSLETIEHDAFRDCNKLTTLHFAEDAIIYSIGDCAFSHCTSLSNLILPDSLECIGRFAFGGAGKRTQEVHSVVYDVNKCWLPDGGAELQSSFGLGVVHLSSNLVVKCGAFSDAILDEVVISANSLEEGVFKGAVINSVIWDSNISRIPTSTFHDSVLGNFKFMDINTTQLREIGPAAFANCKNLLTFNFPNSLIKIDNLAFSYAGLQKVVAPPSLKHIGVSAFEGCECHIIDLHNVDVLDCIGMRAFKHTPIKQLYINTTQEFVSDTIVDGCDSLMLFELGKDVSCIAFSQAADYSSSVSSSLTLIYNASTNIKGLPHTSHLALPFAANDKLDSEQLTAAICTEEYIKEHDYFSLNDSNKIIVTYI